MELKGEDQQGNRRIKQHCTSTDLTGIHPQQKKNTHFS